MYRSGGGKSAMKRPHAGLDQCRDDMFQMEYDGCWQRRQFCKFSGRHCTRARITGGLLGSDFLSSAESLLYCNTMGLTGAWFGPICCFFLNSVCNEILVLTLYNSTQGLLTNIMENVITLCLNCQGK